jgi:hypothetical protein
MLIGFSWVDAYWATIKAHPSTLHRPRPYGQLGTGHFVGMLTGGLVAEDHGDVLVLFENAVVDEDYFASF